MVEEASEHTNAGAPRHEGIVGLTPALLNVEGVQQAEQSSPELEPRHQRTCESFEKAPAAHAAANDPHNEGERDCALGIGFQKTCFPSNRPPQNSASKAPATALPLWRGRPAAS